MTSSVPADRCKVILVAPDTSSVITRPSTSLLADGIAAALREDEPYIVGILPSYTDASSSTNYIKHYPLNLKVMCY